ncbi:hypothetical protein KGM_211036 [Danaus plexippus plexippus]|uniref:Uncharacterized protein n=1 Tax=Danaus plexippus plexippus TaxID=278856 RepID=A0A212FD49_DANPL|nr:hypothetical protein KGM_211036 [Danaus plexippus plexippus]
MSKPEFDSDGFQIVKSKNSVKSKVIVPTKDFKKQDIKIDIEKSRRRIEIAIEELKESQYLKDIVQKTTDQQLCKAADEMHFKAKTYYNYLHYSRKYKEINAEFKGGKDG